LKKVEVVLTKDAPDYMQFQNYKFSVEAEEAAPEVIGKLVQNRVVSKVLKKPKYIVPFMLLKKPNNIPNQKNIFRFIANLKPVNPFVKMDGYNLPTIDQQFTNFQYKYYFKIDLKDGFHNVRLSESSKLFGFEYSGNYYVYNRLPMGISIAPGSFSRITSKITWDLKKFCRLYVDDILVGGNSIEELTRNVGEVLKKLDEMNFRINPKKLDYGEKINFLGNEISYNGIRPTVEFLGKLLKIERPKNRDELASFLGFVNYHFHKIKDFATLFGCLYLKKNERFKWTNEMEEKFNLLKKMLNEAKTKHYDPKELLVLVTDACYEGGGGYLTTVKDFKDLQVENNSVKNVPHDFIRASSWKWNSDGSKSKSHILDLEAKSIMRCIEKFKFYLQHRRFIIVTDSKPLINVKDSDKDLHVKLFRFRDFLMEFDCTLYYANTKDNKIADYLSRYDPIISSPILIIQNIEEKIEEFSKVEIVEELKKYWKNNECKYKKRKALIDGLWMTYDDNEPKMIIPEDTTIESLILEKAHFGHKNIKKMHAWIIANKCAIRRVWDKLEKFIMECHVCNVKRASKTQLPMIAVKSNEVNDLISIDIAGPYPIPDGKIWVLILVDQFSKHIAIHKFYTSVTSEDIIRKLKKYICKYGAPKSIYPDNAAYFVSEEVEKFCEDRNIEFKKSSSYHKTSLRENAVKRVKHILMSLMIQFGQSVDSNWHELIDIAVNLVNNSEDQNYKFTP
jgi:hypothetical protein